jgi:DNA-binding HxlR family transcriptional regulator
MRRTSLAGNECPTAATLDQVGDWWSMLILRDAFDGFRRFDQFQRNLGVAPNMLARRLKTLVAAGLLDRRPYQERPTRHEYVLTGRGREFLPVLVAFTVWGNGPLPARERAVVLVDDTTGRELDPVLVDRATGEPIEPDRVRFAAGPAASESLRARMAGVPARRAAEN